jgi:hypothetical protein
MVKNIFLACVLGLIGYCIYNTYTEHELTKLRLKIQDEEVEQAKQCWASPGKVKDEIIFTCKFNVEDF